ncbi:MAG TPA: hypothetical protein VM146_04740 [Steroidobacteraceae bacterium]|nr:hypothetical protein [Steroidobacteraceae bacterium]
MKRIVSLMATLSVVALAGCPSTPVRNALDTLELDKQLDELLKKEPSSGVSDQLATLSKQASAQGDASTDAAAAVSFYRISATAAWGAGPPQDTRLLPVSDKGTAACSRLPDGDASQPRDCAILRMAPTLAVLDKQRSVVGEMIRSGRMIPGNEIAHAVQSAIDNFHHIHDALDQRRSAGTLPESFDDYLKHRVNAYFCAGQWLQGKLDESGSSPQQNALIKAASLEAEHEMTASSVNVACG